MEAIYQIIFVILAVRLCGITISFVWREVNRLKRQRGVTMVEYAIMLAIIAIAVMIAAPNIGSAVVGVFGRASSVMEVK